MACLEICSNNSSNPDNPTANYFPAAPPMSHRISFSNDFVESSTTAPKPSLNLSARAPASFDFEFSVSGQSMMSAEELIFKGKILPFKNAGGGRKTTTLREELLAEEEEVVSKGSMATMWKGLLRKAHIGSKLSESVTATANQPPCLLHP